MKQTIIQIADEDYAYLEEKVASGSSSSVEDELHKLVHEDRLSRTATAIDREILKSVNSGAAIVADRRYWDQILALAERDPESP